MPRLDDLLVLTPQITATEARIIVLASWSAAAQSPAGRLRLEGHLTGPRCEYATTLSVRTPLQSADPPYNLVRRDPASPTLSAVATVFEPCFWEPVHPFCYEFNVELWSDQTRLDRRQILVGIRHLRARQGTLELNGRQVFLRGIREPGGTSDTDLEACHQAGCTAWLVPASSDLCTRTDRRGPMLLHVLSASPHDARAEVERLRNHPSVLMWVLPKAAAGQAAGEHVLSIRRLDPSRPIGQLWDDVAGPAEPILADVLLAPLTPASNDTSGKPRVALNSRSPGPVRWEDFPSRIDQALRQLGQTEHLAGLIL